MKSVLIRFTSSKYAEDYRAGKLYLSSLSTYWNLKTGRIMQEDIDSGNITQEDFIRTRKFLEMRQQDFQEGVSAQIPCDKLPKPLINILQNHILYDARLRIEAYGYCNLLCFFRVDYEDFYAAALIDEDNLVEIANAKGKNVTVYEARNNANLTYKLIREVVPVNPLLSSHQCHIVQLPDKNMDNYGDMVILIKDEAEFTDRIIKAVKRCGGECVVGDVHYHPLEDRAFGKPVGSQPHKSIISDGVNNDVNSGLFSIKEIIGNGVDVTHYGSLDKYDIYKQQKEWRVCWLPSEYNRLGKFLEVGNLEDIIEIIPTSQIRERLINLYPGYIPGFVNTERRSINGTMEYSQFMDKVESIDGKCRIIMEIG